MWKWMWDAVVTMITNMPFSNVDWMCLVITDYRSETKKIVYFKEWVMLTNWQFDRGTYSTIVIRCDSWLEKNEVHE